MDRAHYCYNPSKNNLGTLPRSYQGYALVTYDYSVSLACQYSTGTPKTSPNEILALSKLGKT